MSAPVFIFVTEIDWYRVIGLWRDIIMFRV